MTVNFFLDFRKWKWSMRGNFSTLRRWSQVVLCSLEKSESESIFGLEKWKWSIEALVSGGSLLIGDGSSIIPSQHTTHFFVFHCKINVQKNKIFPRTIYFSDLYQSNKKEFKNSFHISLASETPTELPVITNVYDSGSFHDLFPPPIVYTRCHHDDISSSPIYWLQCGEIERWDIFS